MSLMTVVIVAFASVFPAGYKLNYANLQQNKAAGLANAIAEELRAIDITRLQSDFIGKMVSEVKGQIRTLNLNDVNNPDSPIITVGAINDTETGGKFFFIDDAVIDGTGSGIAITLNQSPATPFVKTATIQVTIRWRETRGKNGVEVFDKKFTLVTMNTDTLRR